MDPSVPHGEGLEKYLKDPEAASMYLNGALADGDKELFLIALRNVAEAHGGILKLSQRIKMHRGNLYRMLSKKGNPEIQSINLILASWGLRLAVEVQGRKKAA
jgi:probable addiction module antidote protein